MGLGQTYTEGVLQLLEAKVVLTFQTTSKMMATMHLLGVTIMWCNEPIKLHVYPPTSTRAREYVTARGRHPSGTKIPGPGREVVSWSPPVTPTLKEGPTTIPYGPQRPQ